MNSKLTRAALPLGLVTAFLLTFSACNMAPQGGGSGDAKYKTAGQYMTDGTYLYAFRENGRSWSRLDPTNGEVCEAKKAQKSATGIEHGWICEEDAKAPRKKRKK